VLELRDGNARTVWCGRDLAGRRSGAKGSNASDGASSAWESTPFSKQNSWETARRSHNSMVSLETIVTEDRGKVKIVSRETFNSGTILLSSGEIERYLDQGVRVISTSSPSSC
jgi:hypothetical protein